MFSLADRPQNRRGGQLVSTERTKETRTRTKKRGRLLKVNYGHVTGTAAEHKRKPFRLVARDRLSTTTWSGQVS